jgi:hypothetical protein
MTVQWVRRGLLVVAAVVLVFGGLAQYLGWWDRYVETGLGQWAVAEVARRSGGVYQVQLGHLDFRPMAGSMSFDSAIVLTDTVLDRARSAPLPLLSIRAVGCRISKVSVLGLMLGKRFTARAMGCESVFTAVELLARPSDAPQPLRDSVVPRDSVAAGSHPAPRPPLGLRKFQISNIAFPALQFSLRRFGVRGQSSFEIAHARFVGDRVEFDPTETPGTPEAFSSVGLRLEASNLVFNSGALTSLSLGAIDIGLTDSTLSLGHLALGPTVTDEEWRKSQKVRHDRIRFSLDTLAAEGVEYRTLVRTGEVHVRRVTLHGAKVDVLSDKRLPNGPSSVHASPQANAQKAAPPVRIDTIVVDSSEVSYQERIPDRERAGRIYFASLAARISDLHLPSTGPPLAIDASTRLMGEGAMSVHATVPLDAPDFRFALSGRLGPMPAGALNPFLTETLPVKLKNGQIDSIVFTMNTTGGVNATTLTPYYRDLGIDITNPKGNVRGFLKAGLIEVGANKAKVRSRNPDSPTERARTAKVSRRYEATQSVISFLWLSLRDGLLKAVVK